MSQKTITFAIPCFNSAEYMDKCIQSLVDLNGPEDDVEVIIVDDGSTKDNTLEIAQRWQEEYPTVCRAIHQENGGHGQAVNTGLGNATGIYYKVVDSDDWINHDAMMQVMEVLRCEAKTENAANKAIDMVLANYVYEKVYENKQVSRGYANAMPVNKIFTWKDVGHFKPGQCILMHSVIYRTKLLHDIGLNLPKHTFYVDNIFVYVPLPYVKTMYYVNADMYRYFIGREDQSINESVMMGRMDQQVRITKIMIDSTSYDQMNKIPKLRKYMLTYLSMMMCICNIFMGLLPEEPKDEQLAEMWEYLKNKDEKLYDKCRHTFICAGTMLKSSFGKKFGLAGYRLAQKLFNFN